MKRQFVSENIGRLPPVLILAGGLGTRLQGVYSAGPKVMIPVLGRPFLDYLLTWLGREEVKDIVLCVAHKRASLRRFVGNGDKWGLRVRYAVDTGLLGTAGALKGASELISSATFVAINGDTLLDLNLRELVEFHRIRRALATIAVVNVPDNGRYGSVKMDREGRVTAFVEKQASTVGGNQRVNAGLYVFDKEVFACIPSQTIVSLENEVFPVLIARGNTYGFLSDNYFLDIGVPEELPRVEHELRKRFQVSHSG